MRPITLLRLAAVLGQMTAMMLAASPAGADPLKVLKRKDNIDGSTQLSVGTQLPTWWETKFGMDLGFAGSPQTPAAPNAPQDQSGAAWASVSVPTQSGALPFERASLEARVDTFKEEAKAGTSLVRSVPLGSSVSVVMQSGYWLTQNGYDLSHHDTTASATQTWTTDQVVKVKLLPTNTTIAAGAALNSADGHWLRSISAEQQVYGGLNVSSGVSEAADGSFTKKISAGFRHSW
jgi:hypothetical protein